MSSHVTSKDKKESLNEKIREMFIFCTDLDANNVRENEKELYKEIVDVYGNVEKALRVNGITKKKLKEREKFAIYEMLKRRREKFGEEALRLKNIYPNQFKKRIVESYKTVKAVKDLIDNWNERKVLFEMHRSFITGMKLDEVENVYPELYKEIQDYFGSYEQALESYDKWFGLPTIQESLGVHMEEMMNEDEVEVQHPQQMLLTFEDEDQEIMNTIKALNEKNDQEKTQVKVQNEDKKQTKRRRGRPKKETLKEFAEKAKVMKEKKKRGRPKKEETVPMVQTENVALKPIETEQEEKVKVSTRGKKARKTKQKTVTYGNQELVSMLLKLNQIESEQEAQAIMEASKVSKEQVRKYFLQKLLEAQTKGEPLTDEMIKKDNMVMYFAYKAEYRTMQNIIEEVTKTLVNSM